MGRRHFPGGKVWEGISSPMRIFGKASVPQRDDVCVVFRRVLSRERTSELGRVVLCGWFGTPGW